MINLRYHIVSLVAVFLALGIGVVMGSTVIDRAIVDQLNKRVNRVERSVSAAQAENRKLNDQLKVVHDFADQARSQLARGQLAGVPVLVLAVAGVDRKPVDALRQTLTDAGATVAGTAWFTPKMRLDGDGDTRGLVAALGLGVDRPDAVRRAALLRLATAFGGSGVDPTPFIGLVNAGFVSWEPPAAEPGPSVTSLTALPANLRLVLVSGAGAAVSDDLLAVPLAQVLSTAGARAVAAEAGQDTAGGRGVFVGLLRSDSTTSAHISTVDDLESPMGQAATVLAIRDLAVPRTGHFGVGPGAQRLLPPAAA